MNIQEISDNAKLIGEFTEQILENNLIAEYSDNLCWVEFNHTGMPCWLDDDGEYYEPNELKFNSSWDWLMPIIQKIKVFHNGTEPLTDKQIGELIILINNINTALTLRNVVSIESVYKEVLKFIKWYNLNNLI